LAWPFCRLLILLAFAICLAMMIDPSDQLTLANAANCNPYLIGQEIPTDANLPLGLKLDVNYSEITLQLDENRSFTVVRS
jgi:hypothetical protein